MAYHRSNLSHRRRRPVCYTLPNNTKTTKKPQTPNEPQKPQNPKNNSNLIAKRSWKWHEKNFAPRYLRNLPTQAVVI
jgi:hypothetical protein